MNTSEQQLRDKFNERFNEFNRVNNGYHTPELKQLRQDAMEVFAQNGFPSLKSEEYKYTPITRKLLKSVDLKAALPAEFGLVPPFGEHMIPGLDGYILTFWNGKLVYCSDDTPEALNVELLDKLDHAQQNKLLEHLGTISSKTDAFASLNTALINEGAAITIKENNSLDKPVIIYHFTDSSQGNEYSQTRHLILAERNAQAKVVEVNKNLSPEFHPFQNTVYEIFLEEEAKLEVIKLQTDCDGSILVDNSHVRQKKNSYLSCNTISTSGDIVRNNLNISIEGEACEAHMNGLYLVAGNSHIDNHTLVDHRVANSFSNELYKGIIDDVATGVFNGKIYVQPDAQKTNAFQSNKNILLSDKASMNTKPQLEIWADDVKCSHGATTGQLDEEQVFYLRARGLDEQQAKGLLLYAFATEVIEEISVSVLREYLEKIISERLYHNNK